MATNINSNCAATNDTLAHFLSWAQWLSQRMSGTAGWTQAADAGQVAWATTAIPVSNLSGDSANYNQRGAYNAGTAYVIGDVVTSSGTSYYCIAATTGNAPPNTTYWHVLCYEIWYSTDGISPTIYVKFEYGSSATTNTPALAWKLGTGTDGNGNLTGNIIARFLHTPGGSLASTGPYESDFAGGTGWFNFVLWRTYNQTMEVYLGVDRSRDASGTATTQYFMMTAIFQTASSIYAQSQIVQNPTTGTTVPADSIGFVMTGLASGNLNGYLFFCPFFPLFGKLDNPVLTGGFIKQVDAIDGVTVPVSIYGITHQMMMCSGGTNSTIYQAYTNRIALLMRWE